MKGAIYLATFTHRPPHSFHASTDTRAVDVARPWTGLVGVFRKTDLGYVTVWEIESGVPVRR